MLTVGVTVTESDIMNKMKKSLILGISIAMLMLGSLFMGTSSILKDLPAGTSQVPLLSSENNNLKGLTSGQLVFFPTTPPDLLVRSRTHEFILTTQNVPENNATNIDQIYYRLAAIRLLDPNLGNLSQSIKQYWINQILAFQQSSGGFGTWKHDFSSLSSTFKAVQALKWLGYAGLNTTAVSGYLDRLRNSLTNGYNSHLRDTDSDVYSTHLAVLTYDLLGVTPPNATDVAQVFIRAQNLGASVPSVDVGGFGKQSNRFANPPVIWTSEVTITRAAIVGLLALNQTLNSVINTTAAEQFLLRLQTQSGGWVNTYPINGSTTTLKMTASVTAAALEVLTLLNSTSFNSTAAKQFLLSLESPDGSFKFSTISNRGSLKGTFFALKGLAVLGAQPSNVTKTLQWLLNWIPSQGSFGGYPGDDATLRETFDAVYALTLAGHDIPHRQELLDFVASYRNADGGYGLTGSNVESTFRAVSIYALMKEPLPNASQTIAFLQGLQQLDGGFVKRPGTTQSYVISTYRAIAALQLLNATPTNLNGAITYLKSNQNPDGGFGGFNGDTSDVSSTYRAIRALALLNATPNDSSGAIAFLQQSQNPDGGFKRSNYDVLRPQNVSGAVYTYSAVRGLQLLHASPLNVSGVYEYIVSLRNRDGGFGEHPGFTSDIAYVFTSLWILAHMSEISGFNVTIPDNLATSRPNQDNFTITINGGIGPLNYTVMNVNTSTMVANGTLSSASSITIDTTALQAGTHEFALTVADRTLSVINVTFFVVITADTTSPPASSTTTTATEPQPTTTTTTAPPASSSPSDGNANNSQSTAFSFLGMIFALILVGGAWRKSKKMYPRISKKHT